MQFMPGTWAHYGVDGDGDGDKDVYDQADAVHSAANYLCANGAANPGSLDNAIWHYNHDSSYVATVRSLAAEYEQESYVLPLPAGSFSSTSLNDPHHDYPAIDVPVSVGTAVYATRGGTARTIDNDRCGYGVEISGTDGFGYTYCHASALEVNDGDTVESGTLIMRTGGMPGALGAGSSTGPHLHVDIKRKNGTLVCPQGLFDSWASGAYASPANAPSAGCVG
jgi:murein DD-endopeptidase MepM/ murein hydrolase activator NlpD